MTAARKQHKRPALLALDFHNLTARRYWPKPGDQKPASFITHVGVLAKPAADPWKMGDADGLALLEQFRLGQLAPLTDEDLQNEPDGECA